MDSNSFDASYLFVMPIVIICGIFIYLFGFKKSAEPPVLQSNEEKVSPVGNNKKKSKVAKEVVKSNVNACF